MIYNLVLTFDLRNKTLFYSVYTSKNGNKAK